MKSKYLAILLVLSLSGTYPAAAFIPKNNISLFVGDYHFYGVLMQFHEPLNLIGFRYTRQVHNHMYASANITFTGNQFGVNTIDMLTVEGRFYEMASVGKLVTRSNYTFADVAISYQWDFARRHCFSLGIGPSFTFGEDKYVKSLILAPGPPEGMGDIIDEEFEEKREGYFGGMATLRYDYQLWKNRVNIGAEAVTRYYDKDFPFSINYGLHVGYNFLWRPAKK